MLRKPIDISDADKRLIKTSILICLIEKLRSSCSHDDALFYELYKHRNKSTSARKLDAIYFLLKTDKHTKVCILQLNPDKFEPPVGLDTLSGLKHII